MPHPQVELSHRTSSTGEIHDCLAAIFFCKAHGTKCFSPHFQIPERQSSTFADLSLRQAPPAPRLSGHHSPSRHLENVRRLHNPRQQSLGVEAFQQRHLSRQHHESQYTNSRITALVYQALSSAHVYTLDLHHFLIGASIRAWSKIYWGQQVFDGCGSFIINQSHHHQQT